MSTNTIRLHRVLRAAPERVYRAFLDANALAKWLPPNGFTGKVHQMDARVGGGYKMSFINFTTGQSHSFGGTYVELTPHERIRYTDKFDDPNLPGEMSVAITLKKVSCGTELNIVQEGVPAIIPAEACYLGWQESLTLLAKLVEAEIPPLEAKEEPKEASRLCKPVSAGTPDRRWTLRNNSSGHQHHAVVRLSESPLRLELRWRETKKSPVKLIGKYEIDLRGLLMMGYVRQEGDTEDEVRLRFVRENDGVIVIQINNHRPRLEIGIANP